MTNKPHQVARQTGPITPAIAAARKAASLLREQKRQAELKMLEQAIADDLKSGDHQMAAINRSLFNQLSRGN